MTLLLVKMKLWWWVSVVYILAVPKLQNYGVGGELQVPCYYIFGDSQADNGNNNFLQTLAKANYNPYGIDFPGGPTGRFCNGKTIFDVIAELLGFPNYIPPFVTAGDLEILFGANYASGSAGIREETGQHLGERISLNMQLQNHRTIISRLVQILGSENLTTQHLNRCLYSVDMGSNDYINNYYRPTYYQTSHDYTLDQFTGLLIDQYRHQLKVLYGYGARKFALFGLGLLGCTPDAIDTYGTNGSTCVDFLNAASKDFNTELISLIDELNDKHSDAKFIYIDSFGIGVNSSALGFQVTSSGCCPVSSTGECIVDQLTCPNRSAYAFWDAFHPTEAFNIYSATSAYRALNPSDAYPFDIRHLALLDQGTAMDN
ncbi:hypothetical protein K2173_001196 [Erythroxylum novogranatense]|uniref:GDSL esterase/lipase n=1 Tax=Erythroxylum novogranatense TaxID=1862640 RepID=A0AAV8T300_9ROSI|nr:hypothetical protein K2173_001196 [Erythroxylum novogranatense]